MNILNKFKKRLDFMSNICIIILREVNHEIIKKYVEKLEVVIYG